jgi:hypothetical protein
MNQIDDVFLLCKKKIMNMMKPKFPAPRCIQGFVFWLAAHFSSYHFFKFQCKDSKTLFDSFFGRLVGRHIEIPNNSYPND